MHSPERRRNQRNSNTRRQFILWTKGTHDFQNQETMGAFTYIRTHNRILSHSSYFNPFHSALKSSKNVVMVFCRFLAMRFATGVFIRSGSLSNFS